MICALAVLELEQDRGVSCLPCHSPAPAASRSSTE